MNLSRHPFFTRRVDPVSGVANYVLNRRVAPQQRALYFQTPSMAEQWLWFAGVFPPSLEHRLCVVNLDPDHPDLRIFQQAILRGNPCISRDGQTAYAPIRDGIYRIDTNGVTEEFFRMPPEIVAGRRLTRVVMDLSVTADGKYFLLDSQIGDQTLISRVEVATGRFEPLQWVDPWFHHPQCSPVDPDLAMFGKGPYFNPSTGVKTPIDLRMWILHMAGKRLEPLFEDLHFDVNCHSCHEWWTPDGRIQWCDYDDGIYETTVTDRKRTLIWPRGMIHGQVDRTGRFNCGDYHPYLWSKDRPCGVWFHDRRTGRDIPVATLPYPTFLTNPKDHRSYHFDPHPHFSADGSHLVYTSSVFGNLDVALAPVAEICKKLGE